MTTRLASVIRLRGDKEDEYRRLHADAWPGVLEAIANAGIRNYSIFLRDGLLFSYMEYIGNDLALDMAQLAADPTSQRWWEFTSPCQEPLDSVVEGQWWAPAEEVFHTDGTPQPRQ